MHNKSTYYKSKIYTNITWKLYSNPNVTLTSSDGASIGIQHWIIVVMLNLYLTIQTEGGIQILLSLIEVLIKIFLIQIMPCTK